MDFLHKPLVMNFPMIVVLDVKNVHDLICPGADNGPIDIEAKVA